MAEVRFENVTKVFEQESKGVKVVALDNLNLEIPDGSFTVLLGPSGCGKTTTLRLIAGLEIPTSGDIYIGGLKVTRLHPKERNIAMVFQDYALYPHMSVYDNLSFALKNLKFPKKEIEMRVKEVAEMLQIQELLSRTPRELSGGQRQRVALGRAIVRSPQVYLMDEPLSNLDAKLRAEVRIELLQLQRRLGTTTVYVTHDQVEAMTLGDIIVVMNLGLVQQIGKPRDLYEKPENIFVASFIGSPAMNLIGAKVVRENGLKVKIGETLISIPKDKETALSSYIDQNVIFGIRPEHIYDSEGKDENVVNLKVDVVEYLGSQVLVHARINDERIIASGSPEISIEKDRNWKAILDKEKIHIFDQNSGKRIA